MGEHPPSGPFAASGLSFKSASPRMHRKVLGTEVNYRHDVGAFLAPWDRDGLRGALSAFCGTGGMDSPYSPDGQPSLMVLACLPGRPALGVTALHLCGFLNLSPTLTSRNSFILRTMRRTAGELLQ